MPVTTTLGKLAASVPTLQLIVKMPLAVGPSYDASKLCKLAQVELDVFHEVRLKWIKELGGERDSTPEELALGANKRIVGILAENQVEFDKRMAELTERTVEINWKPISLVALIAAKVSIEPQQLTPLLDDLIIDDRIEPTAIPPSP